MASTARSAPAPDLLARKIENLKTAAQKTGVVLWVNARVDTYLRKLVGDDRAYDETVSRARLYREAGANSIFVPAVADAAVIEKLAKAVVLPLNLLAWPGLPDGATLQKLGVRRLSAGSGIGKVVLNHTHELARAFLAEGRSEPFSAGALGNPQINALMRRE